MDLFKAIQDFPSKYPYRGMVQYICQTSKVTVNEFKTSEISKHFWLDTRNCKRNRKINRQCIFELFGAISQESAAVVLENMIERIRLDLLYYKRIGHIIMGFKNVNLNEWCDAMSKQTTSADELAIFALSKIYQRHTVIFNTSKPWSTLEPKGEMLEEELYEHCQIHLVYMGKDQYANLQRKPFIATCTALCEKHVRSNENSTCQQKQLSVGTNGPQFACSKIRWWVVWHRKYRDFKWHLKRNSVWWRTENGLLGKNINPIIKPDGLSKSHTELDEAAKHEKYKKALDAICKTWSEVKLLQMKSSDI